MARGATPSTTHTFGFEAQIARVEARHRYLLDEFPPRGGASGGDNPNPNGPPTPPPGK